MGENWKIEEREEDEEAAALRRSCGSGEAERRDGRAAVREEVDVILLVCEENYRGGFIMLKVIFI